MTINKIDAMSVAAVAFAAFAAWAYLKPKATSTQSGTDAAYDAAVTQRREVGAAVYQNLAGLPTDGLGMAWDFSQYQPLPAGGYFDLYIK